MDRLRYILSHGVKEDLVERADQWPGVHCVEALTQGTSLTGYWFDRTREFAVGLGCQVLPAGELAQDHRLPDIDLVWLGSFLA